MNFADIAVGLAFAVLLVAVSIAIAMGGSPDSLTDATILTEIVTLPSGDRCAIVDWGYGAGVDCSW